MKTKDTDYKSFFPLEEGGFPDEYPYKESFHNHMEQMGEYLSKLDNETFYNSIDGFTLEEELLTKLTKYYNDGFMTFVNHCHREYDNIVKKYRKDT